MNGEREAPLSLLGFRILVITRGDLGTGEDDAAHVLAVLGVLFRLEEPLHGDTLALLQEIQVCGVLVAAPDLDIQDGACALLFVILTLSTGDCQAEAGYCCVVELVNVSVVNDKTCNFK